MEMVKEKGPEILTVSELASLLQVPVSWIYERTRTGQIPHLRLGKYVRFERDTVLEWARTNGSMEN